MDLKESKQFLVDLAKKNILIVSEDSRAVDCGRNLYAGCIKKYFIVCVCVCLHERCGFCSARVLKNVEYIYIYIYIYIYTHTYIHMHI